MKIDFKWEKSIQDVIYDVTGKDDGRVFMANEAKRLMDPYVPAKNLVLAQNVSVYMENGQGIVHYLSPYAHYQWEGTLYIDPVYKKGAFTNGEGLFWSRPNVAKVPGGKPLEVNKFKHPLATSHWDKAMMTAKKDDLAKAYTDYLKRGAK